MKMMVSKVLMAAISLAISTTAQDERKQFAITETQIDKLNAEGLTFSPHSLET